jgi:endonuclease/exonuclease/phosphatase family metal-dependent hydrolase
MDKITTYVIYRTGKNDITHKLLTKWLDSEITQLNEKPWIITGDLNLGDLAKVNFDPKLTPVGTDKKRKPPNHIIWWTAVVKKHRIEQLVDKPTQKSKLNILDYIFVPEHVNIPFIKVDRSAFCTNFDHYAVIFEVDSYYQRT